MKRWAEYKKENASDLKGPTRKGGDTTRWSGIEGPSLHPIHVGLAVQEFLKAFNPNEYVAILYTTRTDADPSLKPGKLGNSFRQAIANRTYRAKFFGGAGEEGTTAIDKMGILPYAMYEPTEGLKNNNIITRLIDKYFRLKMMAGDIAGKVDQIQIVNVSNQPIKKVTTEGGTIFKVDDGGDQLTVGMLRKNSAINTSVTANPLGIPTEIDREKLNKGMLLIVPRNLDNKLTGAETNLAKRIGAKIP